MWVFIDCVSAERFPRTSTSSPLPIPVFATRDERFDIELNGSSRWVRLVRFSKAEMSDIEFSARFREVRFVRPVTAEMSEIELIQRDSSVRLVNSAKGERSVMLFPPSFNFVRLVAPSSPVKSLMLAFPASRWVKFAISVVVIGSPDALPRAFSTAVRRLGSGMFTTCAVAVNGRVKHINRKKMKRRNCLFIFLLKKEYLAKITEVATLIRTRNSSLVDWSGERHGGGPIRSGIKATLGCRDMNLDLRSSYLRINILRVAEKSSAVRV